GPLAAHLTGHPPDQQFANAVAADGQPLGVMERTYLPNGITHDPHGSLAVIIGVTLGLLSGYLGGWVDATVSRLTETAMAFPSLLLAVGIAVVIGPGLLNVVIIIALFTWYYPCRIVRG